MRKLAAGTNWNDCRRRSMAGFRRGEAKPTLGRVPLFSRSLLWRVMVTRKATVSALDRGAENNGTHAIVSERRLRSRTRAVISGARRDSSSDKKECYQPPPTVLRVRGVRGGIFLLEGSPCPRQHFWRNRSRGKDRVDSRIGFHRCSPRDRSQATQIWLHSDVVFGTLRRRSTRIDSG